MVYSPLGSTLAVGINHSAASLEVVQRQLQERGLSHRTALEMSGYFQRSLANVYQGRGLSSMIDVLECFLSRLQTS